MAKKSKTKYVILGMLSHESLSGYDIKKRVERYFGHFWNESFGQIYPALKELFENGYIVKNNLENDENSTKSLYCITEEGKEYLNQWLKLPVEDEKIRYEILLKLFFSGDAPIEDIKRHLYDFRARQEFKLHKINQFEKSLRINMNTDSEKINKDHFCYLMTVLCGKYTYEANINWCNSVLDEIETKGIQ